MSQSNILPDSRLKDPKGCVMVDWPLGDGTVIRLELEPIFCFNCGHPTGYVPTETMSFVSWLCQSCSIKWGREANLHQSSDREFWDKVAEEMTARWGHSLTQDELWRLAQSNDLGRPLELLARESPYRRSVK